LVTGEISFIYSFNLLQRCGWTTGHILRSNACAGPKLQVAARLWGWAYCITSLDKSHAGPLYYLLIN